MEGSGSSSSQSSLIFTELTDRKLSLATAKKYGVKATLVNGVVASHHYPYFNGHELAATKIRKKDKAFTWSGTPKEVGLFGENLLKLT